MTEFRDVKPGDLKKCAELYVETFNSEPWNDKWTIDTACARLGDIYDSPGFIGLLYLKDDEIVGAVFGNREQWYKGYHYNLKEMFVSPGTQGKGIGRKILDTLAERLRDIGVESIYLFTSRDTTSMFYGKNGFTELDGMIMMIKELSD